MNCWYFKAVGPQMAMVATLTLFGGCATINDRGDVPRLTYQSPSASAESVVRLPEADVPAATRNIAARLKKAGYSILSVDPSLGIVRARGSQQSLVDCGVLTQEVAGTSAEFPANAANAVVFADNYPLGLLKRKFDAVTVATIKVNSYVPITATISQIQDVSLTYSYADRSGNAWRNSQSLNGTDIAIMGDGTRCLPSGKLAQDVAGQSRAS